MLELTERTSARQRRVRINTMEQSILRLDKHDQRLAILHQTQATDQGRIFPLLPHSKSWSSNGHFKIK